MLAEAREARVRRTDARSGTWELLFCAMAEPTLANVVEKNGENGRNYFNVLVRRVNAPRKVLEGWNTMQEVSRMIWRFSRSVQTFFVLQTPAMSAYQGAYGGFLLVLLKAVQ